MESPTRMPAADTTQRAWKACRLLIVSGLFALAGCMGDQPGGLVADDPLRGGGVAVNAPTTPGARGAADAAPATLAATPLVPPVVSPTSTAALTSGTDSTAVSGQSVGDPGVQLHAPQATTAVTRPPAAPPAPVAATSKTVAASTSNSGVVPVSATAVTPVAAGSYEQLQQMLQARGVAWQQLKTGTAKDEWLFVCGVPHPEHNNMEKQFEARAVGAYGLAAIRAVIDEIDKDRSGR